ncbi:MAG: ATP-binding cassette domain-containing protein [Calditrichaeota bacterium]|nr:MAG: ATP-binding cassette domain-containing protein [Calditrichota bacterium]MBL1206379.1 ATP-binding cassette domain-containing protein [Calditrichota bacterium]NOG46205.1 ATP-binding cassette domain-containing protein [Calditrichota bacterium]
MSAFEFALQIASGRRKLVDISNFKISPNKINFLFGESGIGKSIISKAIFGLIDPDDLDVKINKSDYLKYLNLPATKSVQENGFFVFQEPSSHLNPLLPLYKQLSEGSLQNVDPSDEQAIIRHLWNGAEEAFLNRLLKIFPKPYRPSGGEKQRILLAMAFKKIKIYLDSKSTKTALFVFDEPSGSLDNRFRNLFIQLLLECYQLKPFTILIITHDYSIISEVEKNYKDISAAVEYLELTRSENMSVIHRQAVVNKPASSKQESKSPDQRFPINTFGNDIIKDSSENGLVLNDFSKEEYLSWIKKQSFVSSDAIHAGHVLLSVRSGINIFGKRLTFHKENLDSPEIELEVKRGELVYLKAQSGAGKTTVAKIIMGLVKAQRMVLSFDQQNVSHKTTEDFWRKHIWGQRASMVFQHADESLNQNASVLEIFKALSDTRKVNDAKVLRRIQELFDVKLKPSFLKKKIKFLSGGQKQRINILRSLVLDTDILILDEPLNGLDLRSAHKIIEKIKQRQADGKAILLISHNEEIFDKIVKPENIYYLKST